MNTFIDLIQFTRDAEKNRNYPAATGAAFRGAIAKFMEILNEEEKQSIDLFEGRIDQILRDFIEKNKQKMTMSSIMEYKRRVLKVIDDYREYGIDPTKMTNWQRKPKIFSAKRLKQQKNEENRPTQSQQKPVETTTTPVDLMTEGSMTRFEIPLRKGIKAIIHTPPDLTFEEVKKIKLYVQYLEAIATGRKPEE
ncbi:MAG: hypothetical protein Q8Q49_06695 [bacterium]|nr:hypothetical protein [bacterium]